jgi:hypothetical protein
MQQAKPVTLDFNKTDRADRSMGNMGILRKSLKILAGQKTAPKPLSRPRRVYQEPALRTDYDDRALPRVCAASRWQGLLRNQITVGRFSHP